MSAGLRHHSVSNSIFYVRIKMAADLELGALACRCRLKINTFEAQAGAKVGQQKKGVGKKIIPPKTTTKRKVMREEK